jgi:hypothetical protein
MAAFENLDCVSEGAVTILLPPGNEKLGGRLRYDPHGGISVELLDVASNPLRILSDISDRHPMIVGQLRDGPLFTLLGCMLKSVEGELQSFAEVHLLADQMLVGVHLDNPAATPFDEIRVSLTSLSDWFQLHPFGRTCEPLAEPDAGWQFAVTCRQLPRFGFSPTDGGPSLLSDQEISPSVGNRDAGVVRNEFVLRLIPREHFGVEACVEEFFRLQTFFSLLCGHQVFCRSVRLYQHGPDEEQRYSNVVWYLSWLAQPPKRDDQRGPGVLLPLPTVRDVLPNLWTVWTQRYDRYRSAVELYTSTDLFRGQLLNFEFLAIMQALETLHRNRHGGTFAPENDYRGVAEAMIAAIPRQTDQSLRSALKKRLQYGNEFSLRRRLKELARMLPPEVLGLIHQNMRPLLERAVQTRNYLTHYDATDQTDAFHGSQLFWATRSLRWFFVAVLLTDMGVPGPTLANALSNMRDLTHVRDTLARSEASGRYSKVHG